MAKADAKKAPVVVDDNDTIVDCYPVNGDWFSVMIAWGENRMWIERVALWAQIKAQHKVDHIKPIGSDGMPTCEDVFAFQDDFAVFGGDASPVGPTWNEIYKDAESTIHGGREITDVFRAMFEEHESKKEEARAKRELATTE